MALGMVCASALTWIGPAKSDEPAQEPAKLFETLDKNSDGTLVDDEIGEDRKRFYERLVRVGDKNDDHKLSREEFVAAMTQEEKPVDAPRGRFGGDRPMFSPGQMFERMDRDKDGKFTKQEIPEQAPAEMRERLELVFTSSGKSELTREEFEKVMAKYGPPGGRDGRRPEGAGDRPRPEGREMAREEDRRPGPGRDEGPGRGEGAGRGEGRDGGPPRPPEGGFRGFGDRRPGSPLIRVLDRDENGKLNRKELARLVERFEELDRNEDGELDMQELIGNPFGGSEFRGFGRPGFGGPEGMRREGGDRGREMAREDDRRAEGPRDGDRRPEGPRDGDRPRPEGPRDGDRRPEGPRDGDRPRPEGARDGDRPRLEGRPGDRVDGRPGDRPEGRPEGRPGDRAEGRPGPRPDGRPDGGPPRGERGPGRDGGRPGDFFARLDKDGDGSVSKDEAPERMKERFKELDGNGDGKISAEELREAIAKEFDAPPERRERRPELDQ